jgi:hypothetical protein
MKNATVSISFEQEKLSALQFYAGKRDADIQSELDDCLQKLYEKYVPAQTREYIESRTEQPSARPRRPNRPASAPESSSADASRQPPRESGE